jgi:hypothetical protein
MNTYDNCGVFTTTGWAVFGDPILVVDFRAPDW